uniref:Uncharacterized protein n=1 Tax=Ciona savignyi TaxID=51511 RepID=H2ZDG1_CIOSA
MQSLTSSALSGSDAANRAAHLKHFGQPDMSDRPPQSYPQPSKKKPPTAPKPQPHSNSVRQLRRRANSSGQVLPPDPNLPQSSQLRRSMTPNPAKSPQESLPNSPNSDLSPTSPQSNSTVEVDSPKPQLSPELPKHPQDVTSISSSSRNGVSSPTNSKSSEKLSSTDAETPTSPDHKPPTNETKKKSKKSSKSSSKKSSKVGLWLSPKK